jgi:hypothetical protein
MWQSSLDLQKVFFQPSKESILMSKLLACRPYPGPAVVYWDFKFPKYFDQSKFCRGGKKKQGEEDDGGLREITVLWSTGCTVSRDRKELGEKRIGANSLFISIASTF